MAEKDLAEKKLEDHNDVFADILNTLLFGKKFLHEKRLRSGPTESIYKSEQGRLHDQRRDTLKDYPAEIAELLAVFSGEKEYIDMIPAIRLAEQKGERVTMCWVAQELIEKGEKQGENLKAALIQKLFADGRNEDAQKAVNSEQDRKKFYQEYGLID